MSKKISPSHYLRVVGALLLLAGIPVIAVMAVFSKTVSLLYPFAIALSLITVFVFYKGKR